MEHFIIPENYQPALSLHDTQVGIKTVKDFFQKTLSDRLNLLRVSAPLFVCLLYTSICTSGKCGFHKVNCKILFLAVRADCP